MVSPDDDVNLHDAARFVRKPDPVTVKIVPPDMGVVRGETDVTVGGLA